MQRRPALHFAHANGFPAPCYRKLFDLLGGRFDIGFLERAGHDPRFPITDGWPHLVDEQVAFIGAHYREPVLGVGHSLGGYLMLMGAVRRPELFRAVVLLDAPLLPRFTGSALLFAKRVGLIDRVGPAPPARTRRREWPSAQDALAHFAHKSVFRPFDPECLKDYVRFGTMPSAHGVQLRFDAQLEYQIYRTLPHNMAAKAAHLKVPGGFLGGTRSPMLTPRRLAATRRRLQVELIEGGHLFPFERPEATAQAIHEMARRLGVR
jgi:pimeloyl-ACP methyl ester carboxylesterase